jgi:hypothetical protein
LRVTSRGLGDVYKRQLFSGVIGNLFFFDRAGVALIGGIAFVIWAAPYLFVISFGKPDLLK